MRDCDEWLAGIDWDDPKLDTETSNLVGRLELFTTEGLEGLRPEVEFWQEAAKFVARETNSLYSQQVLSTGISVADSSNDGTSGVAELMVLAVGAS